MPPAWTARFAPAKVNLFLHVGPVGPDGYHPIDSLMVFASVGDTVRLSDAPGMGFHLEGDFADVLATDTDNLVILARDRFLAALAEPVSPFDLVLEKRLPIAAGLGGGSADAAAALALMTQRFPGRLDPGPVRDIARSLGADVTACLASRSVIARGRGEDVSAAPVMPALDAVLVNPLAPSATGAVYRAFDALPPGPGADPVDLPDAFAGVDEVVEMLGRTRNDLEGPAMTLQPRIGEVLDALKGAPETLLGRMSGSGATCFALCADQRAAGDLAARVSAARPDWWVRACRFGAA
jgi:4-diphosphocytidyl-2-C-methyl-D-erythritol kinase